MFIQKQNMFIDLNICNLNCCKTVLIRHKKYYKARPIRSLLSYKNLRKVVAALLLRLKLIPCCYIKGSKQ